MVTLFTAHILCGIDGTDDLIAGKYLEYTIEDGDYYPDQDGIFSPDFKIVDGNIHISDEPWWGIEMNQNWLENAGYQITDEAQTGDYWR